ncbi:hypothetical protein QE152_g35222 [Popillia japonica]|uniref:Uncharacterized protein n=1 Tax=Popillia japonica TaxID=7064 RepID=A0AAW1IGC3_POPJA
MRNISEKVMSQFFRAYHEQYYTGDALLLVFSPVQHHPFDLGRTQNKKTQMLTSQFMTTFLIYKEEDFDRRKEPWVTTFLIYKEEDFDRRKEPWVQKKWQGIILMSLTFGQIDDAKPCSDETV